MSGFDKEAERQRLRQQFEKDAKSRKETERMSELLLKGATMTNKHCDVCGDPLFRYQGQEFCATCEGNKQEAAQAEQAQQPAQQEQADPENGEHPVEQEAAKAKAQEVAQAQQTADSAMEQLGEQATEVARQSVQSPSSSSPAPANDLADAQQSLVRTLTKLTKAAEESDDIGRTKEYLEAAHEAADALRAVKKASR